jgi:heme-degrading monooxygenase HmoA
MFVRVTTVRGDPQKIDSAIEYVDGPARAKVEATEGNRGFAVLADREGGRVLGASYWDSAESMRESESRLADLRDEAARSLDGAASFERYEVMLGFRHTIPARGAVVRMVPFQVSPDRVDEAISLTREELMPRTKGAAGLCSFHQLLNRETGTGMLVVCWENQDVAHAFAPTAEQLRARASDRVGARFGDPDVLTMIRSTVQLG